jgi:hypothetical protein
MTKIRFVVATLLMAGAAVSSYAIVETAYDKLPKCSGQLCHGVNCSADVLCVSGAHVKTCADWCGGN